MRGGTGFPGRGKLLPPNHDLKHDLKHGYSNPTDITFVEQVLLLGQRVHRWRIIMYVLGRVQVGGIGTGRGGLRSLKSVYVCWGVASL